GIIAAMGLVVAHRRSLLPNELWTGQKFLYEYQGFRNSFWRFIREKLNRPYGVNLRRRGSWTKVRNSMRLHHETRPQAHKETRQRAHGYCRNMTRAPRDAERENALHRVEQRREHD